MHARRTTGTCSCHTHVSPAAATPSSQNQALRTALVSVQRRVRDLETHVASSECEGKKLLDELGVLQAELAQSRAELEIAQEGARAAQAAAAASDEALRGEVGRQRASLHELGLENAALQEQRQQLESNCRQLGLELDASRHECESAAGLRGGLAQQLDGATRRAQSAEEEMSRLTKKQVEQNLAIARLEALVGAHTEESRGAVAAKAVAERALEQREKALAAATRESEQRALTVGSLETRAAFLQEQVGQLQQQLDLERGNAEMAAAATKDVERSHRALREQLAQQQADELTTWQAQHRHASEKLGATQTELQVMSDRVRALELERKALQRALCLKSDEVKRVDADHRERQHRSADELHELRRALQGRVDSMSKAAQSADALLRTELLDARRQVRAQQEAVHQQRGEIRSLRQAVERGESHCAHLERTISGILVVNADLHKQVLQAREKNAVKSHVTRKRRDKGSSKSSVCSELARAAAAPLYSAAERLCKREQAQRLGQGARQAQFEHEYADRYRRYQDLVEQIKGARCSEQKRSLQRDVLTTMQELNELAAQLTGARGEPSGGRRAKSKSCR